MQYSTKTLLGAKEAWVKLCKALDETVTEFETLEDFDLFYSAVIERLHEDTTKEST